MANKAADAGEVLGVLLRAMATESSVRPLVEAFLTKAILQGLPEFQAASDIALAIGAKLWEAPLLRVELHAVLLDAQLKVLPATTASVQRLQSRFEELLGLLHSADPAKVDWWVKYIEFVQRAASHGCAGSLPSSATLHWRAMKDVDDQALYA